MMDIVDLQYHQLNAQCQTYLLAPAQERIKQAYLFARDKHHGQFRKSGEPYIVHPLIVALYVAQFYLDETSIIAAILHDVVEDCNVPAETIEQCFGKDVRHLVAGVTHLAGVNQLEDIANFLTSAASDVRVVLIKLFDRLHNMQTLEHLPDFKQRQKALETLRIYVPLAAKLGIWQIKTKLETLVFKHLDRTSYDFIKHGINASYRQHAPRLQIVADNIQNLLRNEGIPCDIRIKKRSPYSVYQTAAQHALEQHNFSRAFRLILQVDSIPQCYLALGYIHQHYPHLGGSLADFIGNPRDTFYRSVHTTIFVPEYNPVDIRIRTYELDRLSDLGIVARLQFSDGEEIKQLYDAQWLPELEQLYSESETVNRFIESVFKDVLQKQITIFTPRGKEISLPRGSTALDFAYHVHTHIGHECRGAVVNGKPAELNCELVDGDHVEIIRARQNGPLFEWMDETLGYATTDRAKREIRAWFRRQDLRLLMRQGQEILRDERRRLNVEVTSHALAKDFQLDNSQTLHTAIANGTLLIHEVALAMLKHVPNLFVRSDTPYTSVVDHTGQVGMLKGLGGYEIKLAGCCHPEVGDELLGHVKNRQVVTHRASCPRILRFKRMDALLTLEWVRLNEIPCVAYVIVEAYNQGSLVRDLSIPIAEVGVSIVEIDMFATAKNIALRLKLEMTNEQQLISVIHRLSVLQNVIAVRRLNHDDVTQWREKLMDD